MAVLLPAVAHKEAVELLAWLRLQLGQGQQQQAVQLEQFEAAARDLLSARECTAGYLVCPYKRLTNCSAIITWSA